MMKLVAAVVVALLAVAARAEDAYAPGAGATPVPSTTNPQPPSPTPPETAITTPSSNRAGELHIVVSKFDVAIYGFAELDAIYDSTQSLNDAGGDPVIAKEDSYAGSHGRTTFSLRNSRIGFRLKAPETLGIRSSGVLEADFFGNQPGAPNTAITEAAFFTNPGLRLRHAYLKLESDYVDVVAGQTWNLFGQEPWFFPASVEIQGIPGQVFNRTPQIRVGHMFKSDVVDVEVQAAANRPVQRDSAMPDGVAAVRVLLDAWKGWHTMGATTSQLDAASVGVSGLVRRFDVPELKAKPSKDLAGVGYGVSADLFVPIIPANGDQHDNALSLMGSIVYGEGTADLYTGFNAGTGFPALPNPDKLDPAPTYVPDVDNGLVSFDKSGLLVPIQWTTAIAGGQYYAPGGMFWVSTAIAWSQSSNADQFGNPAKTFNKMLFAEGAVWCDLTPAARFGLADDVYKDFFVDGSDATNNRVQLSAWYIF
jgi:hypothetical protein